MSNKAAMEDALAFKVQATYIAERRTYETFLSEDSPLYTSKRPKSGSWSVMPDDTENQTKQKEDVWVRVARELLQRRRDPCDYIRSVFAGLSAQATSIPLPQELLSNRCEKLYQRAKRDLRAEIKIAFNSQRQKATGRIRGLQRTNNLSMHAATNRVLCDLTLGLSSLFRYCLAYSMGNTGNFPKIMAHFRVAAAIQYMHNKAHYDAVWKRWIPAKFPHIARRIYTAWIDQLCDE